MATKTTTKKPSLPKILQPTPTSIDQMSIAKKVASRLGLKLTDVTSVIEEEQKLTMEYVKMGCKVIKKNYLTLEGKKVEGKKDWISPLTGKKYTIDPSVRVYVRVGRGFKQYTAEKKMPDRLCRFVSGGVELGLKVQEKSS